MSVSFVCYVIFCFVESYCMIIVAYRLYCSFFLIKLKNHYFERYGIGHESRRTFPGRKDAAGSGGKLRKTGNNRCGRKMPRYQFVER